MLIWISLVLFVLIAYVLVDFCSGTGDDPIYAILDILIASGVGEDELLYQTTKEYMEVSLYFFEYLLSCVSRLIIYLLVITKGCTKIDPINFMRDFHDHVQMVSFKNSMLQTFMPFEIASSCPGWRFLSKEIDIFNDGVDTLLPYSSEIINHLQCESVHQSYTQLSHEITCRDAPIYITNAMYVLSILAFSSMVMITLRLVWKSDIDIFLKASNYNDKGDSSSENEGGNHSISEIFQEGKRPNLQISTPEMKVFTPKHEVWENGLLEDSTNSLVN